MAKGNMYDWISETWNPLAGECPHKCSYCSTHKLAQRWDAVKKKYSGPIRLDYKAIFKNLGKNKVIFVVGQNDLFANEVSLRDIYNILSAIERSDKSNTYLFQTKNPGRFKDFLDWLPANSILCTTIETNRHYPEYMGLAPETRERAFEMGRVYGYRKFVTIEPIMDFDLDEMVAMIKACKPEQVNIGADSGNNNLPEPSKEKLLQLIEELKKFTTITRKTNLERLLR